VRYACLSVSSPVDSPVAEALRKVLITEEEDPTLLLPKALIRILAY